MVSTLPCVDGQVFVTKALARLRAEDRGLPQIRRLQSMLRRGVGVHHAGAPRRVLESGGQGPTLPHVHVVLDDVAASGGVSRGCYQLVGTGSVTHVHC
jgi:hypothetical protein